MQDWIASFSHAGRPKLTHGQQFADGRCPPPGLSSRHGTPPCPKPRPCHHRRPASVAGRLGRRHAVRQDRRPFRGVSGDVPRRRRPDRLAIVTGQPDRCGLRNDGRDRGHGLWAAPLSVGGDAAWRGCFCPAIDADGAWPPSGQPGDRGCVASGDRRCRPYPDCAAVAPADAGLFHDALGDLLRRRLCADGLAGDGFHRRTRHPRPVPAARHDHDSAGRPAMAGPAG